MVKNDADTKCRVKYELFINGEWIEITENIFKMWNGRKRMNGVLGDVVAKVYGWCGKK